MALNLENAGALVPGIGPNKTGGIFMVRIKVIKGFYYNGEPLKKDQEIDVPRLFAIDMIAGNRAIEVKVAPPEPEIVKEKPPDEKPAGAEKKAHSTK